MTRERPPGAPLRRPLPACRVIHGAQGQDASQGHSGPSHDTHDPTMTDYDMHDLIRSHAERLCRRLQSLDRGPERYDQRLTRALQLVLDAEALLDECDG